jgi:hypothetical protein
MTVLMISAGAAVAQDYAIDWNTVDGGGEMWSTGGDYELGGTIGQPDAGAMTGTGPGGDYTLSGGFWAVPPCWCLADVNNDGQRNAADIQNFVECMLDTGTNCACADADGNPGLTLDDVTAFVADLLDGAACPVP